MYIALKLFIAHYPKRVLPVQFYKAFVSGEALSTDAKIIRMEKKANNYKTKWVIEKNKALAFENK